MPTCQHPGQLNFLKIYYYSITRKRSLGYLVLNSDCTYIHQVLLVLILLIKVIESI